MSGFIDRLVARARGAEALRPRLPARFEAQRALPSPQAEDDATAPRTHESSAPTSAAPGLHVAPGRGQFEVPAQGDPFASGRAAAATSPGDVRVVASDPAPGDRSAGRSEAPIAAAVPPSRAASPGPLELRARAEEGDSREAERPPGPSRSRADNGSAVPTTRAPTTPAPASTPAPRAVIQPVRSRPPAALPITPRPVQPPQPARRPVVAETTVSISIGRLEVRLSPDRAAPGAPREAARTPVMSLDDYLRSRAGR